MIIHKDDTDSCWYCPKTFFAYPNFWRALYNHTVCFSLYPVIQVTFCNLTRYNRAKNWGKIYMHPDSHGEGSLWKTCKWVKMFFALLMSTAAGSDSLLIQSSSQTQAHTHTAHTVRLINAGEISNSTMRPEVHRHTDALMNSAADQ